MALREESQHAQCGICTRHKLLIKRLSGDRIQRDAQMAEYATHLRRQYADRTEYWKARTRSRLPLLPAGDQSVCFIIDGHDHSKYRYPRDTMFSSKEYSGFVRPCLDATACITHGQGILMVLSEPFVRKDSSWTTEVIAHSLNKLAEVADLRRMEVLCQADNTSREVKNNTLTRFCGFLTGTSRVRRMELRFLQSGHSHEDVDAWFSVLSNVIESHKHLQTPEDFPWLLQDFLTDLTQRPHELHCRDVMLVNAIRDWSFDLLFGEICYCPPIDLFCVGRCPHR